MHRAILATSLIVSLAPATVAQPDVHESVVYRSGTDGYHTYRIPGLVLSKKGTLLAFIEGRKTSRSDAGDIDMLLKRSIDGAKTWTDQQIVYEVGGDEKITIGNPCPVVDRAPGPSGCRSVRISPPAPRG